MKIVVLYNAPTSSEESEQDTKKSAQLVCDALNEIKEYSATLFEINKNNFENFNLDCDFVFNLVEWTGEEVNFAVGAIERIEKLHIPYSGARSESYRLNNDKKIMKKRFDDLNIPTPKWWELSSKEDKEQLKNAKYPLFVKFLRDHCSLGISQSSVKENFDQIEKLDLTTPLLVEEYIDGDEIHVGILEGNDQPLILPPIVMTFKKKPGYWGILTHEVKWGNNWEYEMSDMEVISDQYPVISEIKEMARKCFVEFGGRGYSRVDMRYDGKKLYVLEINNNPGLDWDMDNALAFAASTYGFKSFSELLKFIVTNSI